MYVPKVRERVTTPAVSEAVENVQYRTWEALRASRATPQLLMEAPTAHNALMFDKLQVPGGPVTDGLPIVVVNAPTVVKY